MFSHVVRIVTTALWELIHYCVTGSVLLTVA